MNVRLHKQILNRCIPAIIAGIQLYIVIAFIMVPQEVGAGYNELLRRYNKVDTTLTNSELRELYLGYSQTEEYRNSQPQPSSEPLKAVKERPLSLKALFDAAIYMKKKGKKKAMAKYANQFWLLGEMLYREYVGDAENPYPILYRDDEQLILYNWNNVNSIVSETEKMEYDMIECAIPPDWIDFYYFRLLSK